MTEFTSGPRPEQAFGPVAPYRADQYPLISEQYEFFQHALHEARGQEDVTRHRQGPLIDGFNAILGDVQSQLAGLDPTLTPEYIMPGTYQSPTVHMELVQNGELGRSLRIIKASRSEKIATLARETTIKHLAKQAITPATLDIPPYCKQGDGWDDFDASTTCANACFRMVFGGITGWVPNEKVVAESYTAITGSSIVEDSEYHKLFQTKSFKEKSDKKVTTMEIIGADFATIDHVASLIKERKPGAQVYAVVSLASTSEDKNIWHANVLVETTDTGIICHDPSDKNGSAYKSIPRNVFARRWAVALNRVQLFIAA